MTGKLEKEEIPHTFWPSVSVATFWLRKLAQAFLPKLKKEIRVSLMKIRHRASKISILTASFAIIV